LRTTGQQSLLLFAFLVDLAIDLPVPSLDLHLRGLLEHIALAPDTSHHVFLHAVAESRP
jgi:hypothetical protein